MTEMHDTTEEYLETIFEIEEEGIVPIRARLVERLRLSAPSVSETVNRLVEQGNVEIWQGLGFTTHLLGDCHPLAAALGSIHCVKKYLARS